MSLFGIWKNDPRTTSEIERDLKLRAVLGSDYKNYVNRF